MGKKPGKQRFFFIPGVVDSAGFKIMQRFLKAIPESFGIFSSPQSLADHFKNIEEHLNPLVAGGESFQRLLKRRRALDQWNLHSRSPLVGGAARPPPARSHLRICDPDQFLHGAVEPFVNSVPHLIFFDVFKF